MSSRYALKAGNLHVLQPVSRSTLFGEPWDPSIECWTLRRADGRGSIHIGYVPWLADVCCRVGSYRTSTKIIAKWEYFPIEKNSCLLCSREKELPWNHLLPIEFDPPTKREQALVIADWWDDRGEVEKANLIRSWT